MIVTRRRLLQTGGAAMAAAGGMVPVWAHASTQVGAMQIDTLSDGNLVLPRNFILGAVPEEEAAAILDSFDIAGDSFTADCNLTLMRDGTNTVIFDAGSGPNFMPSAGKLLVAMDALGVDPAEVTHVLFTHAHPDHLWGALDDFDEPFFMNAAHLIGAEELAYWMDPETVNTIGTERQAFAAGASRILETLDDYGVLETFDDGAEVLPGITARQFGGHTPGHMVFDLNSEGAGPTVVGDVIGNHHLAFARPGWPSGSDQDPEAGIVSRSALLAELAESGRSLIGYHLPFPGIGTAVADGDGYRFVAA